MIDDTPPEDFFLESMSKSMRCGLLTNARGEILIIHDKEISAPIQWVEYDLQNNIMTIIHGNGMSQDLGVSIDEAAKEHIKNTSEVSLVHIHDKAAKSSQRITLIIHA